MLNNFLLKMQIRVFDTFLIHIKYSNVLSKGNKLMPMLLFLKHECMLHKWRTFDFETYSP